MLKLLGNLLDRFAGVIGGLVWAAVISLIAYHGYLSFGYSGVWVIGTLLLSLVVFPLLSLWRYRYFGLFGGLILECFSDCEQDGIGWRAWFLGLGFLLGLIAMVVGVVMHLHAVFLPGLCGFLAFAIWAPGEFRENRVRE